LQNGKMYRWNMRAFTNAGVSSDYSSTLYFQTPAPTLTPPIPLSPGADSSPGPTINTLTPTFSWQSVSGADYYRFSISIYPYGTSNIIYTSPNLSGTSFNLPSGVLQNGKMYRWNMRAFTNAGVSSDYSSTLYFQTPAPTLTPPINLRVTSVDDKEINLSWDAPLNNDGLSITYYKIYRGTRSNEETLLDIVPFPISVYSDKNEIINDKEYFYKVKAVNAFGSSEFSNEVIGIAKPSITKPSSPALVLPNDKVFIFSGTSINFLWSAVKNADYYELYIRETSNNKVICTEQVKDASFILDTKKLVSMENYSWKVRAANSKGFSEFSEERTFYFSGSNEVLTSPNIPQNYGTITIPETLFPEGKGASIPVYIPPIIDDTNIINADGWQNIWQRNFDNVHINGWIVLANFSPESADNPKEAAVNAVIALLSAVAEGQVYVRINITIQKSPKNEFRAIIKLGCDSEEFLNTMAGAGEFNPMANFPGGITSVAFNLDQQIQKKLGNINSDSPFYYYYSLHIDSRHKDEQYSYYVYLSKEGNITLVPIVYSDDYVRIKVLKKNSFLGPLFPVDNFILRGEGYASLLERLLLNGFDSAEIVKLFRENNIILSP